MNSLSIKRKYNSTENMFSESSFDEDEEEQRFEVLSLNSNDNFELDDEIENDIQSKIEEHQKIPSLKMNLNDEETSDDFFNFSNEHRQLKNFERFTNNYNNYYLTPSNGMQKQNINYFNKNQSNSNSNKVYTKEEKEEIFSKVEIKIELKPECDEVFDIYHKNYIFVRKIEMDFQMNEIKNKSNIEPIDNEFDTFNIEEYYVSKKEKKTSYSLSPVYNFFQQKKEDDAKIKQTKFDFFRSYTKEDEEEDNELEFDNNPFYDDIRYISKKEEDNDSIQNYINDSENESENEENVKNSENKNNNDLGEISKIFYKTKEYFDKNCFVEKELVKNYDEIYLNCKPGEKYNNVFKRCIEHMYHEKYFYEYFGKTFFENVYTCINPSKPDEELDENDFEFDENIFNISLMNIVTKNIHPDYLITRDFFKCYGYIFSFIEDVIIHHYYHIEQNPTFSSIKSYQEITDMISDEKKTEYLTNRQVPGKYLIYLTMWLYALTLKDIYITKESIITNMYCIGFIFEDLNEKIDEFNTNENENDIDSDNESVYSNPEPEFDELKMVNNNYQVDYDSFCL